MINYIEIFNSYCTMITIKIWFMITYHVKTLTRFMYDHIFFTILLLIILHVIQHQTYGKHITMTYSYVPPSIYDYVHLISMIIISYFYLLIGTKFFNTIILTQL